MQKANTNVRCAYIGTYFDLMRYIHFGTMISNDKSLPGMFFNNSNQ